MLRLLLAMSVFLFLTGCVEAIKGLEKTKNFQQQLPFKREVSLSVMNQNGSVAVQAQDGVEFSTVTATLKATASSDKAAQEFLDQIEVKFAREGNELVVETIVPRPWTMKGKAKRPMSWAVDYTIIIPDKLDVKCQNTNGDIGIVGENGKVEAQTQNGNIHVKDNSKETFAGTINGNIDVINDQDYEILVRASTTNGNLNVDMPNARMGQFVVKASNGNIKMNLPSGLEPKIDLNTTNGNIDVYLGTRLSAQVEIRTTNGYVSTNMVVNTTTGVGGILEKKVIKGVVGSGFGSVNATTKNGNIKMDYGEAPSGEAERASEDKEKPAENEGDDSQGDS